MENGALINEMRELARRISEASEAYYTYDNPIMSDEEWDGLYDRLRSLESESGIVLEDSPTRKVGGRLLAPFENHTHLSRLLSLNKAKTREEVESWAAKLALGTELVLEYKFDGLKLNLTYDGGRLVLAATRGNGDVGEVITRQAMTIRSIPITIPFKGKMEVSGEAFMRKSILDQYNITAAEPLKNARNAAAGALRNLDPAVTAERRLDAFFYSIGFIDPSPGYASLTELRAFLIENGFPVGDYFTVHSNIDSLFREIELIGNRRDNLDYLIDGVVIKVNDNDVREAMGYTDKFPHGEIAFKFEAERVKTRLLDVVWDVGRTGKLTPVAVLEPIYIAGATVSRATLNNMGDIRRKGLLSGCEVIIRRSNDVIPEVLSRAEDDAETGRTAIEPPAVCPACGSHLEEIGANLFCTNSLSCGPQLVSRIVHYCSRDAMDIEAFSTKTARLLFDKLDIREIAGLYTLTKEKLLTLEGFADKKAENLLAQIEKSKQCELHRFIFALGAPGVGKKLARTLADSFASLDALMSASERQLIVIDEIGDVLARDISSFFADKRIRDSIFRLLDLGISPEHTRVAEAAPNPFSGRSVVLTGTLSTLTREEAQELLIKLGAKPTGSVSAKTGYVVYGDKAGSKLAKASALGVTVVDESSFLQIVNGAGLGS